MVFTFVQRRHMALLLGLTPRSALIEQQSGPAPVTIDLRLPAPCVWMSHRWSGYPASGGA
ncbi:hypothetical protein PC123_g25368 [Phytophthora cactorum]|nr:hypothetical protein PC120_g23675 [Phytophthora cactorum]KAG4039075.1 hypothetical protein PC123_g25368 [Phytophthora cactorum]